MGSMSQTQLAEISLVSVRCSNTRFAKFLAEFPSYCEPSGGGVPNRDLLPFPVPYLHSAEGFVNSLSGVAGGARRSMMAQRPVDVFMYLAVGSWNYQFLSTVGKVQWTHNSKRSEVQEAAWTRIVEHVNWFLGSPESISVLSWSGEFAKSCVDYGGEE